MTHPPLNSHITETPHLLIPLADGTRLAARIWRPDTDQPIPAILEYLPYRKRDGTAARDAYTMPFLAAHGYACIRVDFRGQGESTGVWDDEYSKQEMTDGLEVIDWLATQDWCDGNVGMQGISWGGFNGLQLAALAPAPLKAVISLCATTDRYADDIHYKGGVMLGENPGWAATALSWFSPPPDPELVPDWRAEWMQRLEATPFLLKTWAEHQARDEYWKQGSVCEDFSAIKAAVLSVGGWHDGYRNTPRHLVQNVQTCRGLIGPWNHKYPHLPQAAPGPQIDFLGEMLRWYDQFLKGQDRGCLDEPPLRLYRMDGVKPQVSIEHRPGTWVADAAHPADWRSLHLACDVLSDAPAEVERSVAWNAACGLAAGEYFPFGFGPGELPDDQRADDALSACFDSPNQVETDIVGPPRVRLRLSADRSHAQVVVRLCALRPDGTSALITMGLLNLRHRNGHAAPQDVTPGEQMDVEFTLDDIAYRLPAGQRLRLAISPGYFPFAFPDPEPVTLTIHGGQIDLPMGGGADLPDFDAPRYAPPQEMRIDAQPHEAKRIVHDLGTKTWAQEITGDDGAATDLNTGLTIARKVSERFSVQEDRPETATADLHWTRTYGRGDWQVRTEAKVRLTGGRTDWDMEVSLEAFEDKTQVFTRTWSAQVPRG